LTDSGTDLQTNETWFRDRGMDVLPGEGEGEGETHLSISS